MGPDGKQILLPDNKRILKSRPKDEQILGPGDKPLHKGDIVLGQCGKPVLGPDGKPILKLAARWICESCQFSLCNDCMKESAPPLKSDNSVSEST